MMYGPEKSDPGIVMRTSKAHAGRRAGAACHRRWNAYGKCRTTDNRPYDKESFANQGLTSDVFTMQSKSDRSITTPKKAQCRTPGSTVPESGTRRPAKAIVSSKSMGWLRTFQFCHCHTHPLTDLSLHRFRYARLRAIRATASAIQHGSLGG
jgi:hypothetical protein